MDTGKGKIIYNPDRAPELAASAYNVRSPRPMISKLQISTTPPEMDDDMLVVQAEEAAVSHQSSKHGREVASRTLQINQRIFEVLCANSDEEIVSRKRFDNLSASPSKKVRLTSNFEKVLGELKETEDLSDLLKLQMIALSQYKEDDTKLHRENKQLRKEVGRLREQIRDYGEFLLTLAREG